MKIILAILLIAGLIFDGVLTTYICKLEENNI